MASLEDLLNNSTSAYNQGSPMKSGSQNQFAGSWQEALANAVSTIDALRKPSLWSRVPAGTPTLTSKTLDEQVRAQKVAETLSSNELAEVVRHNKAAEALSMLQLQRAGSSGGGASSSASSTKPFALTSAQYVSIYNQAADIVNSDPNSLNMSPDEKIQKTIETAQILANSILEQNGVPVYDLNSMIDTNKVTPNPTTNPTPTPTSVETLPNNTFADFGNWLDKQGAGITNLFTSMGKSDPGTPPDPLNFNMGGGDEQVINLLKRLYSHGKPATIL